MVARIGRDAMMDELIERLGRAIGGYDLSASQVPARSGVAYEKPEWGLLEWMPAHFQGEGTTVKLVGYHPGNPVLRGMPSVISTICVFDTSSGHLLGIVDGTFLTALRTGAASAVASRILAKAESRVLGVIGCGAQSVTQIQALSRGFQFERVLAYDVDLASARSLGERIGFTGIPVDVYEREGLGEMLAACDILCTCTSCAPGEGPVFEEFENREHLHINAVGSDFHDKFEVPVSMLRRAVVCADFPEQAMWEGESQQLEASEVGPSLRTLVQESGDHDGLRDQLTVFDSTGWALEDHVTAMMAMEYAREMGLGREAAFECVSPDPKDPYSFLGAARETVGKTGVSAVS